MTKKGFIALIAATAMCMTLASGAAAADPKGEPLSRFPRIRFGRSCQSITNWGGAVFPGRLGPLVVVIDRQMAGGTGGQQWALGVGGSSGYGRAL